MDSIEALILLLERSEEKGASVVLGDTSMTLNRKLLLKALKDGRKKK